MIIHINNTREISKQLLLYILVHNYNNKKERERERTLVPDVAHFTNAATPLWYRDITGLVCGERSTRGTHGTPRGHSTQARQHRHVYGPYSPCYGPAPADNR